MTGCVFAYQLAMHRNDDDADEKNEREGFPAAWRNRVYMIGKTLPLLVEKSQFSKPTAHCRACIDFILGE